MEEGPKLDRDLTFLTAWFCPFAQRTWIALEEKKLTFKIYEVAIKDPSTGLWRQLNEKPRWFLDLSPLGKVPCLAYREESGALVSVFESLICNEFLEDYASPPVYTALFPQDPVNKARARTLIDRFDRKFIPNFYGLLSKPEGYRRKCKDALVAELLWLEGQIDQRGPYFLGQQFSAVDCAIVPWFIRLYILKHYRDFELPKTCKNLVHWYDQVMSRDSVQTTLECPESEGDLYEDALLRHYSKYADGTANSTSAKEWGGTDDSTANSTSAKRWGSTD